MLVFLDTEFTDLLEPQLLSLALVSQDGREHYVELDLTSSEGKARVSACSDFVRYGGVLDLWGRVPGATCSERVMGHRTGDWLMLLQAQAAEPLEIGFDDSTDYELLEQLLRDTDRWSAVRTVVTPRSLVALRNSLESQQAAESCYLQLRPRGLMRHHALADALALRSAFVGVQRTTS